MAIVYTAPKGTEVSTRVNGEDVRFAFAKDGTYKTDDPDLIAILDDLATTEGHPIAFQQKGSD